MLGKYAEVLTQLANMSGKLLEDRKLRKLAEEMEEEMFGVTPGTVTKVLKLADAVDEVLRVHLPALKPVMADKNTLRQVLENIVREWWARNVDSAEAEYVGRYASVLA